MFKQHPHHNKSVGVLFDISMISMHTYVCVGHDVGCMHGYVGRYLTCSFLLDNLRKLCYYIYQ